jgi:hypothetical protein
MQAPIKSVKQKHKTDDIRPYVIDNRDECSSLTPSGAAAIIALPKTEHRIRIER